MSDNQDVTQGKRLKKIRKEMGFTQVDFAKTLEIPQSYLSQLERGENSISKKVTYRLYEIAPWINLHWFLVGIGDMKFGGKITDIKNSPIELIILLKRNRDELNRIIDSLENNKY